MTYKHEVELGPNLYRHLLGAPESRLFHEKHINQIRHPADILREHLETLSKLFQKIANMGKAEISDEERAELTKSVILRLDEFYEQLQVIIKCFTPPSSFQDKGRLDDALRSGNKQAWDCFYGRTKNIHEPIRIAANALKHAGARLMFIQITSHLNVEVNGFYLSRLIGEDDQRGPDPKIHGKYRGKINTAFSFNHFLVNVVGRVHCYMDSLDKALFEKSAASPMSPLPIFDALVLSGSHLSRDFFPDEYAKPYTKIEKSGRFYTAEFPCRYKCRANENPDSIRSVRMPINVNLRTSASNSMMPYIQLIHPEKDLGLERSPGR